MNTAGHLFAGCLHLARIEAGVRKTRRKQLRALAGHIDQLSPAERKVVEIWLRKDELIDLMMERGWDDGDEGGDES